MSEEMVVAGEVLEKKNQNDTSQFFKLTVNEPELIFSCSGGMGANGARYLIEKFDPVVHSHLKLIVIESDSNLLRTHFSRPRNDDDLYCGRLWKWFERKQLKIVQIGDGSGMGGNHKRGAEYFNAAMQKDPSIMEFFSSADAVIQMGGAGGGTASGVMPIIAKKMKALSKSIYSLFSFPRFDEGIDKIDRAKELEKTLTALCPSTPIRNQHVKVKDLDVLTSAVYRDIDQAGLFPTLLFMRSLIQDTGEVQNIDLADYGRFLQYGNCLLPGLFKKPVEGDPLDGLKEAFLHNPYLNSRLLKNAGRLLIFYRGKSWTEARQHVVRQLLQSQVSRDIFESDFECKWGIKEEGVPEDDESIGFLAVAKSLAKPEGESRQKKQVAVLVDVSAAALPAPASDPVVNDESAQEPIPASELDSELPLVAELAAPDSTVANDEVGSSSSNGHSNGNTVLKPIRALRTSTQEQIVVDVPEPFAERFGAFQRKPPTPDQIQEVEDLLEGIRVATISKENPNGIDVFVKLPAISNSNSLRAN